MAIGHLGVLKRALLVTVCPMAIAHSSHASAQSVVGQAGSPPLTSAVAPGATGTPNAGESVIVTGTRSVGLKARDSSSPVDVYTSAALTRSGQPNLTSALSKIDPSVALHAETPDTANLTSAIILRGLNPDDTLVLVDGKRRNGTANIDSNTGPQQGSTPVDINMIPSAAIDHIEILRDGASAQYGSDAVAGVVNIITNKSDRGTRASIETGADAYSGDGWTTQANVDTGMRLGHDGYLHLGGAFYHADPFIARAIDDRTRIDDNNVNSTPEETRETLSIAFGGTLVDGVEGYGLITYGHRHAENYANFRPASTLPGLYADGFTPRETDDENEYSATLGLKGNDLLGFRWDLSSTYGADDFDNGNKDTANPLLYEETGFTPTSFLEQTITNAQWTNNLDLSRRLCVAGLPSTFSLGAEQRVETYSIGPGIPASYELGGSTGETGVLPQTSGGFSRDVWAAYVEDDLHPIPAWDVDAAGRFEHYTDVGNTENGKLSSRYNFTPRVAVRGTISTGFRAPTLAEEHYSTLVTLPTGANGILPVDSAAARSIGAVPLKPERSTNVSGGIVLRPVDALSVTLDLYQINIRDRIIAGGNYSGVQAEDAIALTGVQLPPNVSPSDVTAAYFSNGASTRSQGLDLSSTYSSDFGTWGTVDWTAALDLERTRLTHLGLDSNGNPLLNAQGISFLTTETPRSKLILNALWRVGEFDINVRQTRYGEVVTDLKYEDQAPPSLRYSSSVFYEFKNTPRWLTDIETGYRINSHWHVAIGANDIFDVRPRRLPAAVTYLGTLYYDYYGSQVPISGGFYYGRVNYTF